MELAAALHDIGRRRIEAFTAHDGTGLTSKERMALVADATTAADIQTIHDAIAQLDDFGQLVVSLVKDVWPEWGRGRCPVCGMTSNQAQAVGNDCQQEC